ncbi:MAG: hypothetical protein ACM3ZS_10785 [Nitrososphaerota archaeon]
MVKDKKATKKNQRKSNSKDSISSDRVLRMHLPEITANELKKLKTDESYKEGFLLAVRLMTSELKTLVYKKSKQA